MVSIQLPHRHKISSALCRLRDRSCVFGSTQQPAAALMQWVRADIERNYSGRQPGNAPELPEGSSPPDYREVIMTVSEYEERFRSPTPSLHQIFAAAWGPNSGRWRSRGLWVAVALVEVMT